MKRPQIIEPATPNLMGVAVAARSSIRSGSRRLGTCRNTTSDYEPSGKAALFVSATGVVNSA